MDLGGSSPTLPGLRTVEAVPPPPVPRLDPPWNLRPVDPRGADLDLVHAWMRAEHVAKFLRQPWSRDQWREELTRQLQGAHELPCLLRRDTQPIMYLEIYRAAHDPVAACYPARPHDLGLHLAIGDRSLIGMGIARAVLPRIIEALWRADPRCTCILVEPDVGNAAAIRTFMASGFSPRGEITLPNKTALLLTISRRQEDVSREPE
ncbi:acetyltransferase [Pendulispora rubella]|uniref:Acetyltransferase n=1 Tax=Pendulispora rubella TaxID=2741070 RepID=A0ABZ2L3I4_9BACT